VLLTNTLTRSPLTCCKSDGAGMGAGMDGCSLSLKNGCSMAAAALVRSSASYLQVNGKTGSTQPGTRPQHVKAAPS
jgi:hypothetical protein